MPDTNPLEEAIRALERIRDDYGDVWGGRNDVDGVEVMDCVCCGSMADEYEDIDHDVDCPVTIASKALDNSSTCGSPPVERT